jgi:hypothetical protein
MDVMMANNSQKEIDLFLKKLQKAREEMSLICFIGAGVSISQGYPTWDEYVEQLINYWTFHLSDITKHPETIRRKVDLNDIRFLEDLQKGKGTNKRKVDLVDFLIKEYCETPNAAKSEQLYHQYVLDFERMMFSEVNPSIRYNHILDDLIKLQPTFITTNYDKQIEESYLRQFGYFPQILRNVGEVKGPVQVRSVFHLHGVPDADSNPDLFVSSSQSYQNVYAHERGTHKVVQKLLQGKKQPLILFVGCSMEEEEILSLMSNTQVDHGATLNLYALMQLDESNPLPEVNVRKNEFLKKYYQEIHHVTTLWYGEHFAELPLFIEEMSRAFAHPALQNAAAYQKWRVQMNQVEDLASFQQAVQTGLIQEAYQTLDELIGQWQSYPQEKQIELIRALLTVEEFTDCALAYAHNFPQLWRLIAQDFGAFDEALQQKVVDQLEQVTTWDDEVERVVEVVVQEMTKELTRREEEQYRNQHFQKFTERLPD